MGPTQFRPTSPGSLVTIPGGWAFVPAELPPAIELPRVLLLAVDEARGAISRLDGQARVVSNVELIMRPFTTREAVLSSRIEGTQTEIREVLLDSPAPTDEALADRDEVHNYLAALDLGRQWVTDTGRVSVPLLREVHARLLQGVRGEEKHPGQLRAQTVYIGNRGSGFEGARFVPPPPEQVPPLLESLVEYLAGPSHYGPLVDAAIGHYQFETIHPFEDGNGRVGRLLIPLHLMTADVLERPVLYLSAFFQEHRTEYMDHLLRVSTEGAWVDWILFFLEAIRSQADDSLRRVRTFLDMRDRYTALLREQSRSHIAPTAVDAVLERVALTASDLSAAIQISAPTARKLLEEFEALGILQSAGRRGGGQRWVAEELLRQVYES